MNAAQAMIKRLEDERARNEKREAAELLAYVGERYAARDE
tara:strand:+ start:4812 stop:4931 length:120 start_codon:yes stop_codon:yes gene_type:complete